MPRLRSSTLHHAVVPVDLTRPASILQQLSVAGFKQGQPTVWLAEDLVYFLEPSAAKELFQVSWHWLRLLHLLAPWPKRHGDVLRGCNSCALYQAISRCWGMRTPVAAAVCASNYCELHAVDHMQW
jgi:hypothetical protein